MVFPNQNGEIMEWVSGCRLGVSPGLLIYLAFVSTLDELFTAQTYYSYWLRQWGKSPQARAQRGLARALYSEGTRRAGKSKSCAETSCITRFIEFTMSSQWVHNEFTCVGFELGFVSGLLFGKSFKRVDSIRLMEGSINQQNRQAF